MDYEEYLKSRLARLRTQANVSARDMSLSMGQSPGYINKIENGQNLPSMSAFFVICEYLEITPKEFFTENTPAPQKLHELSRKMGSLTLKQLTAIEQLIDAIKEP